MTVSEIGRYLAAHRSSVIAFGVRLFRDSDATIEEQEYPEGEEQDSDGSSETIGMAVGCGVTYAIYHNFLANRTPQELRAFLKNRRIPHHARFAKELERLFVELQGRQ